MIMPSRLSTKYFCLLLLLIIANSQVVHATVGATEIHTAVNQFMQQHLQALKASLQEEDEVSFQITALDSRLAFADCQQPLDVSIRQQTNRRITTTVACPDSGGWSLFVPVDITLYQSVVVASGSIARGTQLNITHLDRQKINTSLLRGSYFTDIKQVVGQVATRTIAPRQALLDSMLEAPRWIERGQQVTIFARNSSISVRMNGTALSDGSEGDRIRVRNNQSKRIIQAVVTAPGEVEVAL